MDFDSWPQAWLWPGFCIASISLLGRFESKRVLSPSGAIQSPRTRKAAVYINNPVCALLEEVVDGLAGIKSRWNVNCLDNREQMVKNDVVTDLKCYEQDDPTYRHHCEP